MTELGCVIGATTIPDGGLYAGIALILGACFKFAIDIYKHVHGRRDAKLAHDDVREIVKREAPYVADRKFIVEALRRDQEQITALAENVTKLLVAESSTATRLASLEQRVEEIHSATTSPEE